MVRSWATRAIFMTLSLIGVCIVFAFGLARFQGGQSLSVQSGSMSPAIDKGDLVVVKSAPYYQVGDVITFISPANKRTTITHRVIAASEGVLQTKGDANDSPDPPIRPSMVVGKVHRTIPYLGYGVDFVRRPLGLLLVIYIPALMVIAHEIRLLSRHYKRLQPYLAPGRQPHHTKRTRKQRFALGTKTVVVGAASLLAIAVPARAALFSQATLAGNTIAAVAGAPVGHVLLRRIEFGCSLDNNDQVNKLPGIIMHNPTDEDIDTGGWYIQSNEGRLLTFRPRTAFDAHDDYDIQPDLVNGVQYGGDFLALFDSFGTLVDAISWGTDTTYLNPPLPDTQGGTIFRRVDLVVGTNTAADWAVSVAPCSDTE